MPKVIRITKALALRRLADVPQEKRFWCCDGKVFQNLRGLKAGLEAMSDGTFSYHSNEQKADFAKWVREVIGDETLAQYLARSQSRNEAAQKVAQRLTFYEGKLA